MKERGLTACLFHQIFCAFERQVRVPGSSILSETGIHLLLPSQNSPAGNQWQREE